MARSLTSAGVLAADLLTRPGEAPGVVLGLVLLGVHRLLVVEQRLAVLEGAAAELALALPVHVVAVHVQLVRRVEHLVTLGAQEAARNLLRVNLPLVPGKSILVLKYTAADITYDRVIFVGSKNMVLVAQFGTNRTDQFGRVAVGNMFPQVSFTWEYLITFITRKVLCAVRRMRVIHVGSHIPDFLGTNGTDGGLTLATVLAAVLTFHVISQVLYPLEGHGTVGAL